MRKTLISLAAAASAVAFATPASAQYYPQPYGSGGYDGYGGYGRGYSRYAPNGWVSPAELERRIDNVLRGLDGGRYDRSGVWAEAMNLKRELHYAARNGFSVYEARAFDSRIGQLEMRKGRASAYRGYGYGSYYDRDGDYGRRDYERRGDDRDWRDDDDD
jgi:hypothetical protein